MMLGDWNFGVWMVGSWRGIYFILEWSVVEWFYNGDIFCFEGKRYWDMCFWEI